jgi:hypothetical protein
MKKIILSAAVLAFAGITNLKAADNSIKNPVEITAVQDSTTRTPIELSALPDTVKATLQSDKYKDWTPTAAFEVKTGQKLDYYQVDAKKEQETASIKIGADGVVIE